jgi:hypothetical protein
MFIDPQDYDFSELDKHITLVEEDLSGLGPEQQDPVELEKCYKWITRRGYALTLILIFVWPLLSIPAGVFSKNYFAFWVLIAIAWGFGAALVIMILPVMESTEDTGRILTGIYCYMTGKEVPEEAEEEKPAVKEVEEPVVEEADA